MDEGVLAIVATVLGVILGYLATQIQNFFDRKRKLRALVRLLHLELVPIKLKIQSLDEGDPIPFLSLEVWKAVRSELAAVLNDQKLLGDLCVIAYCVEEWNTARPDQMQEGWKFKCGALLMTLEPVIPALERMAGWKRKKNQNTKKGEAITSP